MTSLSKTSLIFDISKFFLFDMLVKSFKKMFLITSKSINNMYVVERKVSVLQTIKFYHKYIKT